MTVRFLGSDIPPPPPLPPRAFAQKDICMKHCLHLLCAQAVWGSIGLNHLSKDSIVREKNELRYFCYGAWCSFKNWPPDGAAGQSAEYKQNCVNFIEYFHKNNQWKVEPMICILKLLLPNIISGIYFAKWVCTAFKYILIHSFSMYSGYKLKFDHNKLGFLEVIAGSDQTHFNPPSSNYHRESSPGLPLLTYQYLLSFWIELNWGPIHSQVWRPNLNVVVYAIGPETNFTLETDGKCVQKTNENSFKSPIFTIWTNQM